MLIISGGHIVGNTAPNVYAQMKPWQHACGAFWWTCSNADGQYELAQLTGLVKRTQAEMEAMPEYITWALQIQYEDEALTTYTEIQTVPNWLRTFTRSEAEAYIEENVVNLATAKTALKHIAQAIIIFRNCLKLRS